MQIALIGAEGRLGRALRLRLGGDVVALGHADVEIRRIQSVEAAFVTAKPDLVINTAAYNQVDRAEDEPDIAFAVNAFGPRNLALACEAREIPLLHLSTDYVFSGWLGVDSQRSPYTTAYQETDRPDPNSAYGASKLAGEHFVRSICRRHYVVRTCGLYGPTKTPGAGNFVQTMLRLGRERGEVDVVDDQTCTPTLTADLARAIEALIATDAYGLYHATNSGSTTWCEFAREIFRLAPLEVSVNPISSQEFGAQANRPCYSVLAGGKLAATVGFELPPWKDTLKRYINEHCH
jgi:dTDP-4-dehydrorhamnose reductase